jgi:hypothetical protein
MRPLHERECCVGDIQAAWGSTRPSGWGRDGDIGFGNATHAASQMPSAELVTVDQLGHFIWLGDPAVTAELQCRVQRVITQHTRASVHSD